MALESIDKVKPKLRCNAYILHIPIALKHVNRSGFCFILLPLSFLSAKYKYVCDIIATIIEYDSTEAGTSLYCHSNRQTVFITGSLRLSLKHWKHFLILSSYANIF